MVLAHDSSGSAGLNSELLSEKTNFGAKIALSQQIDGAAHKTYSGTQDIRGPYFLDAQAGSKEAHISPFNFFLGE